MVTHLQFTGYLNFGYYKLVRKTHYQSVTFLCPSELCECVITLHVKPETVTH